MPVRVHVNFMVHREEDKFKAGAMEVVKSSKVNLDTSLYFQL